MAANAKRITQNSGGASERSGSERRCRGPVRKRITKNQSGALERSGSERRRRSPVRKTDLQKPWWSLRAQWQPTQKGSLKTQAAPQSSAAASEGVAAPRAKRITKNQSGALERSGSERRRRSPVRKTDLQKPRRSLRAQWQPTQKGSLKTQAAPQSAVAASEGVAAPCAKRITKNQSDALERSGSKRRRRSPARKTDLPKPWR